MKITRIDLYQVEYNYTQKYPYMFSGGRSLDSFTSAVVKISTDEGLCGFGEICPLGSAYMEAYAQGVPSGIRELAPAIIGRDPSQLNVINQVMDSALEGNNYVKSPVDIACWDILGKATNLPVCVLLGGKQVEHVVLYRAISQHSAEQMAQDVLQFKSEGYRKFQLKIGGEPNADIRRVKSVLEVLELEDTLVADANRGWLASDAIRFVNAMVGERIYVEQPCRSLKECLVVRRHTDLPMVLDEVITDVDALMNAWKEGAMDAINIKISRLGGLTKSKIVRDICEALGIIMTIEDSWGGDITTATIAHLAGSTRPEFHFSSTDFNSYIDLRLAEDAPTRKNGILPVPLGPGLGINVEEKALGRPVLSIM